MIKLSVFFILGAIIPVALSQWREIQGSAHDISAKGDELWATGGDHAIYRFNNKTKNWVQQPGNAVRVGASPDGWTWAVDKNDLIYRFNINTKQFESIPGSLMYVNAISKDRAIGVTRGHNIVLYENDEWIHLPGAAVSVCIGEEDERWAVSAHQEIYRWNHDTESWIHVNGKAVHIDCQRPAKVIATGQNERMYAYKDGDWHMLPGIAKRGSLGTQDAFAVASDGHIYVGRFAQFNSPSTTVPAAKAKAAKPAKAAAPAPAAQNEKHAFAVPTIQNVDKELDDNFKVIVDDDKQ